jgi:hypothetical protein
MDIANSFRHVASSRSVKVALQDDEITLTCGELDDLSARVGPPADRTGRGLTPDRNTKVDRPQLKRTFT